MRRLRKLSRSLQRAGLLALLIVAAVGGFFVAAVWRGGDGRTPFEQASPSLLGYQTFPWPQDFGTLPLAGALVQLTPRYGFRYLIPLSECGFDSDAITPVGGVIALPSVKISHSAGVVIRASVPAMLSFGQRAKASKTISLESGLTANELLLPGRVAQNAIKNHLVIMAKCGHLLKGKNVFWISDALRSRSFKLTFHDEGGAKISINASNLPAFVQKATSGADISATQDGSVEVVLPIYVGFRQAVPGELLTGELTSAFGSSGDSVAPTVLGDYIFSKGIDDR